MKRQNFMIFGRPIYKVHKATNEMVLTLSYVNCCSPEGATTLNTFSAL